MQLTDRNGWTCPVCGSRRRKTGAADSPCADREFRVRGECFDLRCPARGHRSPSRGRTRRNRPSGGTRQDIRPLRRIGLPTGRQPPCPTPAVAGGARGLRNFRAAGVDLSYPAGPHLRPFRLARHAVTPDTSRRGGLTLVAGPPTASRPACSFPHSRPERQEMRSTWRRRTAAPPIRRAAHGAARIIRRLPSAGRLRDRVLALTAMLTPTHLQV